MRVYFKGSDKFFDEEQKQVLKEFTLMLQKNMPLSKDVHVYFIDYRKDDMTTGLRSSKHELYILSTHRMFVDVLRTLAHEWSHEFEHQKLKVKDSDTEEPQIGTPEENLANVLSGIMTKRFDYEFPQYNKIIYGES